MNTPIEIKAIADRLRALIPESPGISVDASSTHTAVHIHGIGDYQAGTLLMQRLGIGEREKVIFDANSDNPRSILRGEAEGITFIAYCSTIPPSCRIETTTVRIPKTQTVDTGEFIEVQERVVKCGHGEAVA